MIQNDFHIDFLILLPHFLSYLLLLLHVISVIVLIFLLSLIILKLQRISIIMIIWNQFHDKRAKIVSSILISKSRIMKITFSCYWNVSTVRAGTDGENVILLKFYENCFILVILNCLSRTSTVCPEIFLSYFYHFLISKMIQKYQKLRLQENFKFWKIAAKKKLKKKKSAGFVLFLSYKIWKWKEMKITLCRIVNSFIFFII